MQVMLLHYGLKFNYYLEYWQIEIRFFSLLRIAGSKLQKIDFKLHELCAGVNYKLKILLQWKPVFLDIMISRMKIKLCISQFKIWKV